jgi:hypothetical protein
MWLCKDDGSTFGSLRRCLVLHLLKKAIETTHSTMDVHVQCPKVAVAVFYALETWLSLKRGQET